MLIIQWFKSQKLEPFKASLWLLCSWWFYLRHKDSLACNIPHQQQNMLFMIFFSLNTVLAIVKCFQDQQQHQEQHISSKNK